MPSYRLDIDGVGSARAVFADHGATGVADQGRWAVGSSPSSSKTAPADWTFLAPLRSEHLVITFADDDYFAAYDDRSVRLRSEDELPLPGGVTLRFHRPHPWTPAATLKSVGPTRPADGCDTLVLATGSVVIGSGDDSHVVCPDWPHSVVFLEHDGQPCWKRLDGPRDSFPVIRLTPPSLIETEAVRLHVAAA